MAYNFPPRLRHTRYRLSYWDSDPYTRADHLLNDLLKSFGFSPVGLIFSGSMFALICAYTVRFSAMAIGGIDASFQKYHLP